MFKKVLKNSANAFSLEDADLNVGADVQPGETSTPEDTNAGPVTSDAPPAPEGSGDPNCTSGSTEDGEDEVEIPSGDETGGEDGETQETGNGDASPEEGAGSDEETGAITDETEIADTTDGADATPNEEDPAPTNAPEDDGDSDLDGDDESDSEDDAVEALESFMVRETAGLAEITTVSGVIEQFGCTPSIMAYASARGLLANTALESMALESFDPELHKELALEEISEKASENERGVLSRIMDRIKGAIEKAGNGLQSYLDAFPKSWGELKTTAKAHPYATAATAVGALAALAGIVVGIRAGVNAGLAKKGKDGVVALGKTIAEKFNKIKGDGFKVTATEVGGRVKVKVVESATKVTDVAKSGWDKAKAVKIGTQVSKWGKSILDGLKGFWAGVVDFGKGIKTYASSTVGAIKAGGDAEKIMRNNAKAVSDLTRGKTTSSIALRLSGFITTGIALTIGWIYAIVKVAKIIIRKIRGTTESAVAAA